LTTTKKIAQSLLLQGMEAVYQARGLLYYARRWEKRHLYYDLEKGFERSEQGVERNLVLVKEQRWASWVVV